MKKTKITREMTLRRDYWLKVVSRVTGITPVLIMGRSRKQQIVIARHLLSWALYRLDGFTLMQVGQLVGHNHASVYHSVGIVEDLNATSKPYAKVINEMIMRR